MKLSNMKKIVSRTMSAVLCLFLFFEQTVYAENEPVEEPDSLYSISAVLLDGDSGRLLYEKNGYEVRAMASTTKIMTCIVALESSDIEGIATVSQRAARQPKVHLGMREGQKFKVSDLLYSLMLESHNDSAVAIAEYVGGTVEGFADLMNKKAKELGCADTYFITPNGLDESKEADGIQKIHSTTAADLARIMRYCTFESERKDKFLEITRTTSYSFSDAEGNGSYSCNNHNTFLQMMDGALSGKTGYTNDAGYCYVGALERDGKRFVVALLGCGWPNNKSYKWSDTKKLMNYGLDAYEYQEIGEDNYELPTVYVTNGKQDTVSLATDAKKECMLLRDDENVVVKVRYIRQADAPIKKGDKAGVIQYTLGDTVLSEYSVCFSESVAEKGLSDYMEIVWKSFLQLKNK